MAHGRVERVTVVGHKRVVERVKMQCSGCKHEFAQDARAGFSAYDYKFCPYCGVELEPQEKVYDPGVML
jgi:rRNA maturation endonuclease Nob1